MSCHRILSTVFVLILPLISLGPGCSHDTQRPDSPEIPDGRPRTPEEVLIRYETALESRDFEEYVSLLAEDFTAISSPEDTTGNDSLDIPESWGREQERESIRTLFSAPDVSALDLSWEVGEREPPSRPGTDARIRAGDVRFTVSHRESSGGIVDTTAETEEWIFHLRGEVIAAEDTLWEIAAWEDSGLWLKFPWGLVGP